MNLHLAEVSRTLDAGELGRRIRNARVAAGMTQTALAGEDVTAAYVSRIEDGQRRPEFGLLGRMAERMGTSLEALLLADESPEGRAQTLALAHAELSLAGGEPRAAFAALESLPADLPEAAARRAALIRAGALEAIGDLNGAIMALEDLRSHPTRSADWLKGLIALCRCYKETGELDRAIAVGEDADATISELDLTGLAESIQLTVSVAAAYLRRGDLDVAMRLCRRSIERAEEIDSPVARASAYWNASLVESRNGASQVALDLAAKALVYFELGEDLRNIARLRCHVADMQLELDPPDAEGAIATLERASRELAWSSSSPVDQASQLQTRARAHLLLGDIVQARRDVEASLEIVPSEATTEQAYGLSVLGEVAIGEGNTSAAREALISAVRLLTAAGSDREVAQLWVKLGTHLRNIGETEAALDAFERATVSVGLATAKDRASLSS